MTISGYVLVLLKSMAKTKKIIYLDHAATTPMDQRVLKAMQPYFCDNFGNPSSLYKSGLKAQNALMAARQSIAKVLGCLPEELIFTAGGTESDNLAILGIARAWVHSGKKPGHIITSAIEHHAVLRACEYLEKYEGWKITKVPVDRDGLVDPTKVAKAITKDTVLVSIMYANNEIGTVQPIREINEVCKNIYFHTDACQAAGFLDLDVKKLGVDLMTINGSKIYGPKGVGVLYVKRGVVIEPLVYGGGQEWGLRSGTENVPGIVGLAKALELVQANRNQENARLIKLRDFLIKRILQTIPKSRLNGHPTKRLPNNINVTILDVEGEAMLLYLDEYGIEAATGSACDSSSLDPSHVIMALGLPYEFAHGSLRFTLGKSTTAKDINYVLKTLPKVVKLLRQVSPLNMALDVKKNKHPKLIQH